MFHESVCILSALKMVEEEKVGEKEGGSRGRPRTMVEELLLFVEGVKSDRGLGVSGVNPDKQG